MESKNTIQKKIPYGSNVLINCPSCWFKWEPLKYREWRTLIEILLWFLLLIPWAIYTARRHINTFCVCPKCWETYLEEIDWDTNIVNSLIKIKRKQTIRFWVIIIFFSSWLLSFFWESEIKTSTYNKQNYWITNSVNNLTDFSKYNQQINNSTSNNQRVEQKKEESIVVPEVKKEAKEQPKDPNDEVREKMQNILKQINYQYSEDVRHKVDSYIWASCSWDCINWIINIKFAKNLWWESRSVESAAAIWNNNIIKSIPGYFDKLQINYICHDQTITSCTFTGYQKNTMVPKWCKSITYKDTVDEAREKMQNIIKETDKEYSSIDWYIWTTCLWDCTKWIVNVNFSKDIWWRDFTVWSHAAMLNNKISIESP